MAKISGIVQDEKNNPIEFATIYVSDSSGKPIGNVAKNADDKGRFVFDDLKPTDFLTARLVGYQPNTISVSKAITIPDVITGGTINAIKIPLKADQSTNLEEVVITADKPKPKPTKEETKVEEDKVCKPLKIGLLIGGGLLLISIVVLSLRAKK